MANNTMNFGVDLLPTTTDIFSLGSSDKKWNLFVNQINGTTPVTGVKGNAETSYRTGQVNLTAANVGAVAINGNETVAGNKTFSGITNLTIGSTYSVTNGTVISTNASAIIQSPIPKYLWHDIWAFCRATTPKYYTSTNGSSWIEATLEKRLFSHQEAWGESNVLSSSIKGSRWVWLNGNFYASTASWIVLGVTFKNPSAHFNLTLETSSDGGSNWVTLMTATDLYYSQTPIWIRNTGTCQNSLRLTLTWNNNSESNAVLGLCSIRFLTSRWGDQGKGSEFEYPYQWNETPDIYPIANNTSNLGTSTMKWANIYATTFNGNLNGNATNVTGTVAVEHGGTNITSYTKGDILYASNNSTLSKLGISTAGYFLKATANGPAWANTTDITAIGTITTGTWNGTVIGAAYGGTGQNTLQKSANALINALDTGSSDLTAGDYVITQYVGGGTTTTTYHRRPANKVINATLVKAALETNATHGNAFLRKDGTWQVPPYPVTSVAGKTGAVTLISSDVGAYSTTEIDNRLKKYLSYSHHSNQNGVNNGKYYKININSTTNWMLNFTIKLYHAYRAYDLQISGYNYGSSHWYKPAAIVLGASTTDAIDIIFGYDSDYHLWVAIPAQQYTGIDVLNATNGYSQITDMENLFSIELVEGEPTTKQITITAYRPWYRDEIIPIEKGGTGATTSSGALTNLGALPLAGGTMTGALKWEGNNALSEKTDPEYFLVIDAFANGGATHWSNKATVKSALLGTNSTHDGAFLRKDGNWIVPPDTKNTAGSTNSTSKLYLIGATSQAANPTTNSYQYTYTNNGLLSALKLGLNLNGTEKAHLEWNNTAQSIDFIFE